MKRSGIEHMHVVHKERQRNWLGATEYSHATVLR